MHTPTDAGRLEIQTDGMSAVLKIAFSDEQHQNTDNSGHGNNPDMMEKEEECLISIVHLNRRTLYLPRVQRKNVDCQPEAEKLRRPGCACSLGHSFMATEWVLYGHVSEEHANSKLILRYMPIRKRKLRGITGRVCSLRDSCMDTESPTEAARKQTPA
jgi:hypothetical protein